MRSMLNKTWSIHKSLKGRKCKPLGITIAKAMTPTQTPTIRDGELDRSFHGRSNRLKERGKLHPRMLGPRGLTKEEVIKGNPTKDTIKGTTIKGHLNKATTKATKVKGTIKGILNNLHHHLKLKG